MKKSSVLKEIATELGVSINTVSRALRDCRDISEKTKERVRNKAIELGYIQNTLSRLLDNEGKALFAVIIKSFENLYYTSFVQSFIDQSAQSNYTYMVLPTDKYCVDVFVVKQCISQRVSFIITLCHISDKAIEYCQLNKIPICAAGFEPSHPYCSAVVPDYGRMVSLAANYLHEKCGVKDVVYCSKTEALSEINRYHLIRDEWMRICPEGQVTWLTMEQQDEIAGICARKEKGIYCYNDELAFKIIKLAREKNGPSFDYSNMKIVGVDGISAKICGMTDITSTYCDFAEMISVIKSLIKKNAEDPNARIRYKCGVRLHEKGQN